MTRAMIAVSIDGVPLSMASFSRLISCTVSDKAGMRSDSITLQFDGHNMAIPRDKAIITAQYGFAPGYGQNFVGEFADFGAFTVDDVDLACFPHVITVQGKSASMHEGAKEQKERHWDNKSAQEVFGDLAKQNNWTLQIDPAIGAIRREWWGQENVSSIHFARRLGEELNADVTIKNNKLLVTKRGAGLAASGAAVSSLTITPQMQIGEGATNFKFKGREKHASIEAEYHDRDKAKRERVSVPGHPEGKGTHRMRHQFQNKDEAERAAKTRANDLSTRAETFSTTIVGNARARGGAGAKFQGFHPQADGQQFIIETASHSFNKSGSWQVSLDGKSKAK